MASLKMPLINEVRMAGYVGHTPELKYTDAGKAVLSNSIAVRRKKDLTEWFDITAWGETAEFIAGACDKGAPIYIQGALSERNYKGRDGSSKRKVEIIVWKCAPLAWPDDDAPRKSAPNPEPVEDDIPF